MIIRQCIPADRAKAQAFLQSILGEAANGSALPFELRLSLIATEAENVIGVALYRSSETTHHRELAVAAAATAQPLVQELVDKALTKLHAQGIHRCKVVFLNPEQPQVVWQQSRWAGTIAASEAAANAADTTEKKKPAKPKKPKAPAAAAA